MVFIFLLRSKRSSKKFKKRFEFLDYNEYWTCFIPFQGY
jgi:hypothetical protein